MPSIETHGLTKRYGNDIVAVDDLDLTVETGEIFGFLGPNGAGKSTTIDLLLGFTSPSAGHAEVLGQSVTDDRTEVRRDVGVLPEDYALYETLTARDHLQSMIRLNNVEDSPERLLDIVGIDPTDRDRPTGTFSKGMRQRLVLAVALIGDPELLILDEPSSGLDPAGIADVRTLVRDVAASGTTVFFSSHYLSQVEAVCDRIGILTDGQLTAVDTIDGLRERIGGTERLRLDLHADPTTETLAQIRALDGVVEVNAEDTRMTVHCGTPSAKARAIAAVNRDATVVDFSVETTSLEDLFDAYTGSDANESSGEPDRDTPRQYGGTSP